MKATLALKNECSEMRSQQKEVLHIIIHVDSDKHSITAGEVSSDRQLDTNACISFMPGRAVIADPMTIVAQVYPTVSVLLLKARPPQTTLLELLKGWMSVLHLMLVCVDFTSSEK